MRLLADLGLPWRDVDVGLMRASLGLKIKIRRGMGDL